jgi:hypothetical protein
MKEEHEKIENYLTLCRWTNIFLSHFVFFLTISENDF